MVNGVIGGLRTLFWSTVLIAVPLYIVAILLRESVGRDAGYLKKEEWQGADSFNSIPRAFFTVFICVVGGDCAQQEGRPVFVLLTRHHGWGYGLLYCATLMIMIFGLFNVIISMFVENTMTAAKYNEMTQKHRRLQDQTLFTKRIAKILDLVTDLKGEEGEDIDLESVEQVGHIQITPAMFRKLCTNQSFADILYDLDVSRDNQLHLFDTLDIDGGGTLDLNELVLGIDKLRGDPRRADIISVGLVLRSLQQDFQAHNKAIRGALTLLTTGATSKTLTPSGL